MLPQFKPCVAIIIITEIMLGKQSGFYGALTAFVSDFFFGQGPWTPWQMFAFGIIGFISAIFFQKRKYLASTTK
ncbi:MAG: ECF transporter S component [Eubacterium sp.]